MELREEQVGTIKKCEEEEKKVLADLALFGGIILGQRSKYSGKGDEKNLIRATKNTIRGKNLIRK